MGEIERIFLARQDDSEHPVGQFKGGGKWYPARSEHRICCYHASAPTAFYPGSLYEHCKSLEHIENLVNEKED